MVLDTPCSARSAHLFQHIIYSKVDVVCRGGRGRRRSGRDRHGHRQHVSFAWFVAFWGSRGALGATARPRSRRSSAAGAQGAAVRRRSGRSSSEALEAQQLGRPHASGNEDSERKGKVNKDEGKGASKGNEDEGKAARGKGLRRSDLGEAADGNSKDKGASKGNEDEGKGASKGNEDEGKGARGKGLRRSDLGEAADGSSKDKGASKGNEDEAGSDARSSAAGSSAAGRSAAGTLRRKVGERNPSAAQLQDVVLPAGSRWLAFAAARGRLGQPGRP